MKNKVTDSPHKSMKMEDKQLIISESPPSIDSFISKRISNMNNRKKDSINTTMPIIDCDTTSLGIENE